ncbi:protein SYS1 homolog [Tubulanus polymorphus]|uniref:protein SYS1 homolog n=1 Tax=Tubulanus polymorphus TaxID=672921 RepID=UPI003DA60126
MAGFRSSAWDPINIVSQILTIQCVLYFGLVIWIFLMDFIAASDRSLDQLFAYSALSFQQFNGRLIMGAFVLNSLTGAVGLWFIVQRTKLCLDFTASAHFFHLLICWCYNQAFPNTLSWWLTNLICVIIMTVLGEFMCMRTELKAIPLGMGPKVDL